MKIHFVIVAVAGLAACAALQAQTPAPWIPVKPLSPNPPPQRDGSRLPLPGDTGFAWDKLNHRGNLRWECRATPSGQFVRQSFCAGLPKGEGPRPESFKDLASWDGIVHDD